MYFSTTVHVIGGVQSTKDFQIGTTMARNWLTRLGWISTINFMTMVTILHNQHFSDFSPNVDRVGPATKKRTLVRIRQDIFIIYIYILCIFVPYHKPSSNERVPSRGYADTSTNGACWIWMKEFPRENFDKIYLVCCSCQVWVPTFFSKEKQPIGFSKELFENYRLTSQKIPPQKKTPSIPSISPCSVPTGPLQQQAIYHLTKWDGGALTRAASAWKRTHGMGIVEDPSWGLGI